MKEFLFWLLIFFLLLIVGCAIPVRNESNDKPLLTASTGVSVPQADGSTVHNPTLPQPKAEDYQHAPSFNWTLLLQIVAGLAFGTTGVGAIKTIRTLGAAVKDAASYGEDMERAETDSDVLQVKAKAAKRQAANKTFSTIAKHRGKI